ncbi:integrase_H2C2 domain-containing protein, partial [Nephila pilipes]
DASKFAYSTVAFLRVDTGSAVHIQLVQSKVRIAPCGEKETTIASRNVRVVAWILRFIHNISNVNKLRGNLVYEEFKKAENLVFKSMQLRSFQDEKFLAKMQAFKDEEGLLRIRTKLVDSDEKEDFKFPVLLPANDVVVKLIREEHKKAMHAGSYILLARLRENFWIIKAKNDASKFAYSTVAFLRVDTGSAVHIQLVQSKVRIAPCGEKETTIASRNVRVVAWILRFIHNISNVNKLRGNLVYEEFKKAENLVFKSMQLRSFQDEKFLAKMQAFKDEEGLLRIRTKLVDSDEKEDFKFPVLLPANDVVVKLIREEHKKAMHA